MYSISFGDLAANALIELVERTGRRTVSFKTLDEYGDAIVNALHRQNIESCLSVNTPETNRFRKDCSHYFEFNEIENTITLKDSVDTKILRYRFRQRLSLDELKAFVSEAAIEILLAA